MVLLAQSCESALGGLLPVAFGPAVVGGVVGIAYRGADQAMEVERPQAEGGVSRTKGRSVSRRAAPS